MHLCEGRIQTGLLFLLVLTERRRCHFEASARSVCVMLVFILTPTLAVMVVLNRSCHVLVTCGRERNACIQVERQVFSHTFEWEERARLHTTELVMFEVGMECHGYRFRTSDHSTVSLEPLKETLFNPSQMQPESSTTSSMMTAKGA